MSARYLSYVKSLVSKRFCHPCQWNCSPQLVGQLIVKRVIVNNRGNQSWHIFHVSCLTRDKIVILMTHLTRHRRSRSFSKIVSSVQVFKMFSKSLILFLHVSDFLRQTQTQWQIRIHILFSSGLFNTSQISVKIHKIHLDKKLAYKWSLINRPVYELAFACDPI